MKTYIVHCVKVYNGSIEVEAESAEEATQKVQDDMYMLDNVDFYYGETYADFAEEKKCGGLLLRMAIKKWAVWFSDLSVRNV